MNTDKRKGAKNKLEEIPFFVQTNELFSIRQDNAECQAPNGIETLQRKPKKRSNRVLV